MTNSEYFDRAEFERQGLELNTAIKNSDYLPWRVTVIMLVFLVLGADSKFSWITGFIIILLGFGLVLAQIQQASKIHRLGVFRRHLDVTWEKIPRSPLVGIAGSLLLVMPLLIWIAGIKLWFPEQGLFSGDKFESYLNCIALVLILITAMGIILLPFVAKIEDRYNNPIELKHPTERQYHSELE